MEAGVEIGVGASDLGTAGDDARGAAGASLAEAAGKIASAFAPARAAVAALRGVVVETKTALDGTAAAAGGVGDALEEAGGGGGGGGKGGAALDALKEKADALKEKMEEVKGAFKSAFVGLVTGAKSLKESISDLLGKFAEMLASSAFDALWGGMIGGGKRKGIGGFLGGIFGFANGTPSAPGGMALVGERGPELVNLPRGSQVKTNAQTMTMMRGGRGAMDVTVTMDPSTGAMGAFVRDEAGRVVAQARPAIVSQSVSTTEAAMRKTKSFGGR